MQRKNEIKQSKQKPSKVEVNMDLGKCVFEKPAPSPRNEVPLTLSNQIEKTLYGYLGLLVTLFEIISDDICGFSEIPTFQSTWW